jgi:DNA-binding response OmpR family regulator
MRFPQVVIFERDGRLAHILKAITSDNRWVMRESRQIKSCLKTLCAASPTVFVLRLPKECSQELNILDLISRKCLNVRTIVVVDERASETQIGMAWDLGADFVLAPPMSLVMLPEVVARLMPPSTEKRLL